MLSFVRFSTHLLAATLQLSNTTHMSDYNMLNIVHCSQLNIQQLEIMEVIKNNKGGEKLYNEGFLYTKKPTSKTTIRWECSIRGTVNCNGKVTTDVAITRIISSIDHTNHDRDANAVQVAKKKLELKKRASVNRGNTVQVVADCLTEMTDDVRLAMGSVVLSERQFNVCIMGVDQKNQPL